MRIAAALALALALGLDAAPTNNMALKRDLDSLRVAVSNSAGFYVSAADTNRWNTAPAEADPVFNDWLGTNTYVKTEADPYFNAWRDTNTYVKTEADALALSVIATQKISRIELGTRIVDATGGVWEVSQVLATNWYFYEAYNNITTALPSLTYPLPDNFYVEVQRLGSFYFEISCTTDLPWYDYYGMVRVDLWAGGGTTEFWGNVDPLQGISGTVVDSEYNEYPAGLFWKAEPTGALSTNLVNAVAYASDVDAKPGYADVTNIVLDAQQVLATLYGYGSVAADVAGTHRLTNALPMTPLATITNLNTVNGAYVAKFVTGTGLRFTRISQGLVYVHAHFRKGPAGACTLRPEFYLLDAAGDTVAEFDAAQTTAALTVSGSDAIIPIPIPSNIVVTASNRLGVYLKAFVTSGAPDVYIDTEDNVNLIVTFPVPSAELVTQSELALKADKATTLTINGVSGNLSTNNVFPLPPKVMGGFSYYALTNISLSTPLPVDTNIVVYYNIPVTEINLSGGVSIDASAGTVIVPSAGVYAVSYSVSGYLYTGTALKRVGIAKNGEKISYAPLLMRIPTSNLFLPYSQTEYFTLNAGDALSLWLDSAGSGGSATTWHWNSVQLEVVKLN